MKTSLSILMTVMAAAQFFPSQVSLAQGYKDEKIIYLDANGQSTREKKAVLLEQVIHFDDTLWHVNLYRVGGPMILSASSSDAEGRILNGPYRAYDVMGYADTVGSYFNGKREGEWTVYALGGRLQIQKIFYKDGKLISTMDSIQLKREGDSLRQVYKRDSAKAAGTGFTKVEIESEFPGGHLAWLRFMNKTLRYPDYDVEKNIKGIVILAFIVDTEGHIPLSSLALDRSVEYHLDQAALSLISVSPDWYPAVQNGRKVKSYKKQPIVFELNGIR